MPPTAQEARELLQEWVGLSGEMFRQLEARLKEVGAYPALDDKRQQPELTESTDVRNEEKAG